MRRPSDAASEPHVQANHPGARPHLTDWAARTRQSALQALRYTRFVTVMKRALPIAVLAIIASIVAYSLIPRRPAPNHMTVGYRDIGRLEGDLAMIKPRLTGTDEAGHPFTVTATRAVQDPKNIRRARLFGIEADMTLDSGHWMNATAASGEVDMDKGALTLTGGVSLYTDTGYELHTEAANVDLKGGIFRSSTKVEGQGPLGTVHGGSFVVDRDSKTVKVGGGVKTVFYSGNGGKRAR